MLPAERWSLASPALPIYTLSLHDALPICRDGEHGVGGDFGQREGAGVGHQPGQDRYRHQRSEEHTSELQSRVDLVCRLLLEKKNTRLATPVAFVEPEDLLDAAAAVVGVHR